MANFQIVAGQSDYKILEVETDRLIIQGITSFRRALVLYERLASLQEWREPDSLWNE
ncbi:MAG: hypothetical protein HQM00_10135 [Magnetococcales bacterium]|nr:hypothetical protein [Magnetococcales bacterium]